MTDSHKNSSEIDFAAYKDGDFPVCFMLNGLRLRMKSTADASPGLDAFEYKNGEIVPKNSDESGEN